MRAPRRGLWLFSAFSAATFAAVYLLPPAWWVWLGLGLLVPAGIFVRRRLRPGALLCLGAACALLWCGAFRAVFLAPAQALDGRRCAVTAVVSEGAHPTAYGVSLPCWVTGQGAPVKATIYGEEELLTLEPGDRVSALFDCTQTALGEASRFSAAATRGVFLTLKPRSALAVELAEKTPWWCLPAVWGQRLSTTIQTVFPADVSGMLAALVTGDKTALAEGSYTDLARAGVVHLVAVSGMHICFLVSLLTLFTGLEPRRRFWLCAPVVLFFALAVGATASVMRACIFQLAFLLAELTGREEDRWTTITAALAILLLVDPFSAGNVGLQMSFAAVMGIAVVTPRTFARLSAYLLPGEGRWPRRCNALLLRLYQIFSASLGAMVFTVPLGVFYFGSVSLLAPVSNLLILPVAWVLFAGTLLVGTLGMLWPGLAMALAGVLAWLGRYVTWVAGGLAGLPYCAVTFQGYYPAALTGGYALGLLALFWRGRRSWLPLACGVGVILAAVGATRWSFTASPLTVTVLDVGQGQSVLLSSQGRTALVDCGGSGKTDPGDRCADYLNDRGVTTLDTLILTHYHADHANGLDALFRRLRVRGLILPAMDDDQDVQAHILELARAQGTQVSWLTADRELPLGQARLTLYAPLGDGGANEEGASVRARWEDYAALITGDMNAVVEGALVDHARLGRCQVLVAGHHGSNYASGEALLRAIRPQVALISVGSNPYGHPGSETLERLARQGVDVRRTDQEGTLTARLR